MSRGTVHGRFQPFHNGHLDYVTQAFEQKDFISVGLTQIFRPRKSDTIEGRNSAESNPLSFYQRSVLIDAALTEAGIERHRFEIIPFPIETPTRLNEFVPQGSVCFTTELNRWNAEKIRLLEREGYEVVKLRVSQIDGIRVVTGSTIRALIRDDNNQWQNYVPQSVKTLIINEFLSAFLAS